FQSPGQIYLFHVGKKIIVEATYGLPAWALDKQRCPRCPEYLTRIVILAIILFHAMQYPSAAERETIPVYIATCSTGVFKLAAPKDRPDFGLGSSHVGTA